VPTTNAVIAIAKPPAAIQIAAFRHRDALCSTSRVYDTGCLARPRRSPKLIGVGEERSRSLGSSRRSLLQHVLSVGASAMSGFARSAEPAGSAGLAPENSQFLEELEKANFRFFWEQASPETGLVKDRCNVRAPDGGVVASIAATGFGLTALCIGQRYGWVSM